MKKNNMKLIVLENFKEVGEKVNKEVQKIRKEKED